MGNINYFGFVYKQIDSTNGKTYTGSHEGSIRDNYSGSGVLFLRAYKKRPDNFSREILEYVYEDNREKLLKVEQKYLDLIDWSNTYNLLPFARGGSVKGRVVLEETRQKMKGNTNGKGCKGKIVSENTKLKQQGNKNGKGNKGK